MEKVDEAVKQIDDFIAQYPAATQFEKFKELETKTGYSKVYFFLGACSILTLVIFLAGGMKLVTDLVGFLYPAYMSFKATETPAKAVASGSGITAEATQWLTYWVVFSTLSVLEGVAPFIVEYIPMYYLIKVGVIVWLYHPKTTGAEVVYNQVVKPYILPILESTATKKIETSDKKE